MWVTSSFLSILKNLCDKIHKVVVLRVVNYYFGWKIFYIAKQTFPTFQFPYTDHITQNTTEYEVIPLHHPLQITAFTALTKVAIIYHNAKEDV